MRPESVAAEAPAAPQWFEDALAAERQHRQVSVAGCPISYWRWGGPAPKGVVLVHGGGAHARWWDHVAPLLAHDERCVVAIDLSGHGDSGRRGQYSVEGWAEEMLAVAAHAGIAGPPVLAGHSLGGWAAVVAAARHPDAVAGLILMDCRIMDAAPEDQEARQRRAFGPLRVYSTLDEALARYRTVPEQDDYLPFVFHHVAVTSAHEVEGGWTWKFDPSVFDQRRPGNEALRQITCRVALVRGERGLLTPAISGEMYRALGRRAPIVEVPLAGHHLMLDQPLLLVTALRALLADWDHSAPQPPAD
ncbi:MAG: alpha/beta hydrolase [Acidimicrobiaceae bacterium]|nr:alpha/beta hydrolase [Acidimicrobiaceae bacterium]